MKLRFGSLLMLVFVTLAVMGQDVNHAIIFREGERLFNSAQYGKAIRYYYEVLQREKNHLGALYQMATCHRLLSNHEQAFPYYEKVIAQDTNNLYPLAGYYDAQMLQLSNKRAESLKAFSTFKDKLMRHNQENDPEFVEYFREATAHLDSIDLQGHRGARGLLPENTIPGFIKAIDLGVTTLEMDLSVTRDSLLVVSHDPYLSAEICLGPEGQELSEEDQQDYKIYEMTYSELSGYDCGSKPHRRFQEQENQPLAKPLLTQVIDTVEEYLDQTGGRIAYNIELKSWAEYDGILHPSPAAFSDLVYQVIDSRLDWDRVTIQSFDFRVLNYFHQNYPEVKLSLLIENGLPYEMNLDSLGFYPAVYSEDYNFINRGTIRGLQALGIKVIPWTINDVKIMNQLINWGVDGIITDYPDRYPYK